jgi:hypothetical protein
MGAGEATLTILSNSRKQHLTRVAFLVVNCGRRRLLFCFLYDGAGVKWGMRHSDGLLRSKDAALP